MEQRESRRPDPLRVRRVQEAVESDIAHGHCDGVSMFVEVDGEPALEFCAGHADRAAGRPLRADDVFVSLGIGKQFTNTVVLSAIEAGALSLFTQAADLLPCFAGSAWRGVSVAQLLCSTSGVLPEIPPVPSDLLLDTARLSAFAAARGPQFPPGSRVHDGGLAAQAVLAEILRTVDGGKRDIGEILRRELFEPLGMRDTSLGHRDDLMARLCPLVSCHEGPGLMEPRLPEISRLAVSTPGACLPAGGYLVTRHDLQRFVRMLGNGGALDGVRILSPAMIAMCGRNHTSSLPDELFDPACARRGWQTWPACRGLGFLVRGEALIPGPLPALASAGAMGGWGAGSTAFWCDPMRGVSFGLLSSGLMDDASHLQRVQRLSDSLLSSLTC